MKLFIVILLILITNALKSQEVDFGIKLGALYGGAIPEKVLDGFTGTPKLNPMINFFSNVKLNDDWSFIPQLSFSLKELHYYGSIRRDTTVITTIGGVTGQIPTFYSAHFDGNMSLYYLEFPFIFSYEIKSYSKLNFGVINSFLAGGYDEGSVRVVIGEGGFYEDSLVTFDNYYNIRPYELALCLGTSISISKNFNIDILGVRSVMSLNKKKISRGAGIESFFMYNTFVYVLLSYTFI